MRCEVQRGDISDAGRARPEALEVTASPESDIFHDEHHKWARDQLKS